MNYSRFLIFFCSIITTISFGQNKLESEKEICIQIKTELNLLLETLSETITLIEQERPKKPTKTVKKSRKIIAEIFIQLLEETRTLTTITALQIKELLDFLELSQDWFSEVFIYLEEAESSWSTEEYLQGTDAAKTRIKRTCASLTLYENYLCEIKN